MAMRANALAVMAKAPVPGAVKTRLIPALGAEDAAALARALLVDQLDHLRELDLADLYLAFAPRDAAKKMKALAPAPFRLFAQAGADLGARMLHVFETLRAAGYRSVVIVGGDLPPVPFDVFRDACDFLDAPTRRAVLGPSRDGGYYLVGLNRPAPEIFEDMAWSQPKVLSQTIARLIELKVEYRLLRAWLDIDDTDDLRYLLARAEPATRAALKETLMLLRRLRLDKDAP